MSGRLLTEREMPQRWGAPTGDMVDLFHNLLEAQDTKSTQHERQKMSEWLDSPCTEDHTGQSFPRSECEPCVYELAFGLRESKAVWEEKDAVLTTRKTPRTIPPD